MAAKHHQVAVVVQLVDSADMGTVQIAVGEVHQKVAHSVDAQLTLQLSRFVGAHAFEHGDIHIGH